MYAAWKETKEPALATQASYKFTGFFWYEREHNVFTASQ